MALKILSATPPTGATAVPLNGHIVLEFNSEVSASFLGVATISTYIQLYNEADQTLQYVEAGRAPGDVLKIYIKPPLEFTPFTDYLLVVVSGPNGIKNTVNEELAGNIIIRFTTGGDYTKNIITITSGVVTFENAGTTPTPTPNPTDPVVIQDRNNLVNSESAIGQLHYDPVVGLSSLYISGSAPEDREVGVRMIQSVKLYWNEDVIDRMVSQIKIKKQILPFDPDIFGDHSLPITSRTINLNLVELVINETGIGQTNNFEYFVDIPSGVVSQDTNTSVRNGKTRIRFTGPLSPIFSTPELVYQAMGLNGLDGESGTDPVKDYKIWKHIHLVSKELVDDLGYTPNPEDPKMFWVVRYVTCRVAYEELTGPLNISQYVKTRKVLGQMVQWGKDNSTGPGNPLKDCMDNALGALGIDNSTVAPNIGTKSIQTQDYPGRNRKLINVRGSQ